MKATIHPKVTTKQISCVGLFKVIVVLMHTGKVSIGLIKNLLLKISLIIMYEGTEVTKYILHTYSII